MKKILVQEEQKFNQTWIILLIYGILMLNLFIFGNGFIKQIIMGEPWGDKPMSDTALIITTLMALGISAGLVVLFNLAKLKTVIHQDGIDVTFPPFFSREKSFRKEQISHVEVRKYNPVLEYGGWGVRAGLSKGKAYNVKGNLGIQLQLDNGKKILIGTQKKELAESALKQMMEPGS